ncbi:hypothetical protein RJ639_017014 [Escallonia herrerae]|uniref:Ribosomal protein S21 n=1 Tax=Escallonia herrerae TaxID=1293975 RepID=A0AA89AKD2_9ASTE|nr:hypothetical protein RJ639_017014 [Escallonia herrerae]
MIVINPEILFESFSPLLCNEALSSKKTLKPKRWNCAEMNTMARHVSALFRHPNVALNSMSSVLHQWRGIRVKVRNNNLDQALMFLQRQMQSSGMERLIKNQQTHHLKNSEKRVLARKNLERRLRSQDLARKLKAILCKKVRIVFKT